MASQGLLPAVLSGLLAALSSVLGKLAMARDDSERVCMGSVQAWLGDDREPVEAHYICESVSNLIVGVHYLMTITLINIVFIQFRILSVFIKSLVVASSATLLFLYGTIKT